jgi:hypothetical protein
VRIVAPISSMLTVPSEEMPNSVPNFKQALQRGGREEKRHFQALAHDGGAHVDLLDASQDIRHQVATFKGFSIPAVGDFVVSGTVDVMKNRPRHPLACQFTKIRSVVTVFQTHDGFQSFRLFRAMALFPAVDTSNKRL